MEINIIPYSMCFWHMVYQWQMQTIQPHYFWLFITGGSLVRDQIFFVGLTLYATPHEQYKNADLVKVLFDFVWILLVLR